ncbi:hypothetical protein E2I00_011804 [Balaenoptera physalus]|uniref:DUF4550 domain-containing protein n=1 Tax=Balaenoptera physalus TaxID=9770 RepID=A0A6A1Q4I4_BALPH|nr:hypothetical protein E2I00_011804 [Balaenoptera physalus]
MWLQACEWEDEDEASTGAVSSMGSFYQSGSECEVEESLKVRAWAQESATGHQCSGESSEGPASTFDSDVPHVVPCKFIISLAFPVTAGHKGKCSSLVEKYRRHPKMDKPIAKVRHYYHIEYFLLPDDGEPKKVDVVVFPALAKVFLDSGIKTIRPWQEGDKVWVSWTQSFNINMTKELLKKINFHKITLRLWDTKDKVSKKAKHYRLKPCGFLEDAGSFGHVRQREGHPMPMCRPSATSLGSAEAGTHPRPVSQEEVKHLVLSQRSSSEQGIHVKEKLHQDHAPGKPEEARKGLSSGHGATTVEMKELIERPSFSSLTNLLEKQKFQIKRKESDAGRKSQRRREQSRMETDSRLAGHGKQGTFAVQLAVMPLLAGSHTRSQQRPVSSSRVARMPAHRTLAVTEPLPRAVSSPRQEDRAFHAAATWPRLGQ